MTTPTPTPTPPADEWAGLRQAAEAALKIAPGELEHERASMRDPETAHNAILGEHSKRLADSLNSEANEIHEDFDEDGTWYTDQGTYDLFNFWEQATPTAVLALLTAHAALTAEVERVRNDLWTRIANAETAEVYEREIAAPKREAALTARAAQAEAERDALRSRCEALAAQYTDEAALRLADEASRRQAEAERDAAVGEVGRRNEQLSLWLEAWLEQVGPEIGWNLIEETRELLQSAEKGK